MKKAGGDQFQSRWSAVSVILDVNVSGMTSAESQRHSFRLHSDGNRLELPDRSRQGFVSSRVTVQTELLLRFGELGTDIVQVSPFLIGHICKDLEARIDPRFKSRDGENEKKAERQNDEPDSNADHQEEISPIHLHSMSKRRQLDQRTMHR